MKNDPYFDENSIFVNQEFYFPKIICPNISQILYDYAKDPSYVIKPEPPKKPSLLGRLIGRQSIYEKELELFRNKEKVYDQKVIELKEKYKHKKYLKYYPKIPITERKEILNKIINLSVYPQFDAVSEKGICEKSFFTDLVAHFGDKIMVNKTFINPSNKNPYIPDFIFYDKESGLKIDIEIDEPYILSSGEPIHFNYLERNKKDYLSIDHYRNTTFQTYGWYVIRFSEEQILKQSEACCKYLSLLIFHINENPTYNQNIREGEELVLYPPWDLTNCLHFEKESYREQYLRLPKRTRNYIPDRGILEILKNYDKNKLDKYLQGFL